MKLISKRLQWKDLAGYSLIFVLIAITVLARFSAGTSVKKQINSSYGYASISR